MSPKYLLVLLFLGVVVLTCATASLADTRFEEEKEAKAQPFGSKPPKTRPPIKKKPPPPHGHDDERKLTTLSTEELVEDQRPFGKPPKGKGGKPPHGKSPKHPPVIEDHDGVNKDAHKPPYKPPYKPPQTPHKPPHKPPSTN